MRLGHRYPVIRSLGLGAALVLLATALGCGTQDSSSPPTVVVQQPADDGGGTTPTGSARVLLEATATSITAGGQATLTATVTDDDGAAAANTAITFETSLGTLTGGGTSHQTTTDAAGKATVTLSSTRAGSATVVARALGTQGTRTVQVQAGAVARAAFDTPTPEFIKADGTSQVVLTLRYFDPFDNPVTRPNSGSPTGQASVVFTTDLGTFVSTGLRSATVTSVNGVAQVTLQAGTVGGTATVVANDGTLQASLEYPIVKDPSVLLRSSASSIAAGATQATLTATVIDGSGAVVAGATVTFTTTRGTLDGGGTSASATTAADGTATATLAGVTTDPGVALLQASTTVGQTAVSSSPVSVTIVGPMAALELVASATEGLANGTDLIRLTATAVDVAGNATTVPDPAAADGEVDVTFQTDLGTFAGGVQQLTVRTASGVASADLTAPAAAGVANVSAAASGVVPDSVSLTFTEPPPVVLGFLDLNASATSIVADGASRTRLSAEARDEQGNAMSGVNVSLTTSAGSLLDFETGAALATGTVTTDASGRAFAYLQAPVRVGQARVRIAAGGFHDETTVRFVAGDTSAVTVSASPENLTADGGSASTITVRSVDANGNATDDVFAVAAPSSGSVGDTSVSTFNGIGQFTYFAGTTVETVTLTVTNANNVTGSTTVSLVASPVSSVGATAERSSVIADGVASTTIAITVTNQSGGPVANLVPTVSTTLGTLSAPAATDALGRTSVTLTSGTALGTATVLVTAGGRSASLDVQLVPGPPARILASASAASLLADGVQTSRIRAVVLDASNHRVADGTTVSFALELDDLGTLGTSSADTVNGEVTVVYTAPVSIAGSPEVLSIAAGAAETGTGTSDPSPSIVLAAESVGAVALVAGADTVTADGTSSVDLSVTVENTAGQPIVDGTPVSFTVSPAKGTVVPNTVTTSGGAATASFSTAAAAVAGLGPVVISASAGAVVQSATVDLVAGPVATLTLTASPTRIPPDGTTASTVVVQAADADGNPVDGEVTVSTNRGALSAGTVTLINGEGSVDLTADSNGTATVTGTLSGLSGSTDVEVGFASSGEPVNIAFAFTETSVSVAGVGGDESSNLDVTVTDEGGNLIDEAALANLVLTLEIVEGPGGGEELVAQDASGSTIRGASIVVPVAGGKAAAAFRSGTRPGSARIRATVSFDRAGVPITTSATAPKITILAGPPFSVSVSSSNNIQGNDDGTLTLEAFAVVSDQYGNAVTDGTGVFFGQIANVKASGVDGVIDLTAAPMDVFTSAGASFTGNVDPSVDVVVGDTLVVVSGSERGGYLVETVPDANTLDISTVFEVDGDDSNTGLPYVVGNNAAAFSPIRGVVNSVGGIDPLVIEVPPPVLESVVATEAGIARSPNTYAGSSINSSSWVYAETSGRTVGGVMAFGLAGTRPLAVTIIGPVEVLPELNDPTDPTSGFRPVSYTVRVEDSSTPTPYRIPGVPVQIFQGGGDVVHVGPYTNATAVPGGGTLEDILVTGPDGSYEFQWVPPDGAVTDDQYTLTVSIDGFDDSITVAIQ